MIIVLTGPPELHLVAPLLRNVKKRWFDLGKQLGLSDGTLRVIELKAKGDIRKCFENTLKSWLKHEDGVRSKGGSNWSSLISALKTLGEEKTAHTIEVKYLPKKYHNNNPVSGEKPTLPKLLDRSYRGSMVHL